MPAQKRSIPAIPRSAVGTDRGPFDSALKENLEILLGQRVDTVSPLALTATNAQIIAKINEVIARLQ